MNLNLNLATRPYIELRPVYARLRVAGAALAVLALPLLLLLHVEQTKAQLAQARVQQLQTNIDALRRQQAQARNLAATGPDANVLSQAEFLNALFHRKAFSWTATMSDLEGTLPYGVQVQTIDPIVAPDGHVTIRLRITGARDRAVEVVRNLEHSRHFVAPRLVGESLADQQVGGTGPQAKRISDTASANDVTFDILADYRPLPNSHDQAGLKAEARRSPVVSQPAAATAPAQLTNPALANPGMATPPGYSSQRRRPADIRPSPFPKGPFTGVPAPSVGR